MHRPSKQHRNLETKLGKKQARSRKPGKKQKRWKKAVAKYQPLTQDQKA